MNLSKIVVMTTILGGFGLLSTNFATPVAALSLTLSVPSDPLSLEIQPLSTFTISSPGSVSVKTDAFAGYSLSIKAQTNNELVNGASRLTSIAQNLSEEQYQGAGNLNTWGYKPSKFNSLDNTLFLPGPTTAPAVIETTKAANSGAATSYEFLLAAKADATIAHGTYKNTFVFSATANTVSYNIKYELNSGSWSGASPQTGNTTESNVTLDLRTPSRSGYEFKGWCPQSTSNETCGTTSYQPGNSYPLNNGDNTVTLWAMWKPTGPPTISSCQEAVYGIDYILNGYAARKLKDGKCYTTQSYSSCSSPWYIISDSEMINLLGAYGLSVSLAYCNAYSSGDATQLLSDFNVTNSESFKFGGKCYFSYQSPYYYDNNFQAQGSTIYFSGNSNNVPVRCVYH